MSADVQPVIDTVTSYLSLAILILAAYRGLVIGRALTSRIYRNRAFWIAGLCIADALQAQVPDNLMLGQLPWFELTFFVLVFVVFIFIDSTVLVTLDMDFFHRNTLRWRQVRLIAYPWLVAFGAIDLFLTYLGGSRPEVIGLIAGVAVVLYVYAVVALVIGALRTPDRTLRKHILLLGAAILVSAITTFTFSDTSIFWIDMLDDLLGVLGAYLIYRAVMTLSPVGRVKKEAVTSAVSGEGVATSSEKG